MGNITEHEDHAFEVLDELLSRAIWAEGNMSYIRTMGETMSKRTFYDVAELRKALCQVATHSVDAKFSSTRVFEPASVVDNILEEYQADLRKSRIPQSTRGR